MLSMHELSLPEPMLSLSMLILATCPEAALGSRMGQIRMESGWAGMPDGPDGVYRMGPGWFPTAQIRAEWGYHLAELG